MATITAVAATSGGTAVTFATATSGGDTLQTGNKRTTLIIRNGSAGSVTLTLAAVATCNFGSLHPAVITCPVGDTWIVVPDHVIEPDGTVAMTYSAATSVTVAAVH